MRICIFGMGAVGGHLAAKLADAGHEVSAVLRGDALTAVRERGLTLKLGEQDIHVTLRASERPADLGPQDLVISALKANSLPALAGRLVRVERLHELLVDPCVDIARRLPRPSLLDDQIRCKENDDAKVKPRLRRRGCAAHRERCRR